MLAKDIMTKHVVSARLDSTIVELVDLMLKHHISAFAHRKHRWRSRWPGQRGRSDTPF